MVSLLVSKKSSSLFFTLDFSLQFFFFPKEPVKEEDEKKKKDLLLDYRQSCFLLNRENQRKTSECNLRLIQCLCLTKGSKENFLSYSKIYEKKWTRKWVIFFFPHMMMIITITATRVTNKKNIEKPPSSSLHKWMNANVLIYVVRLNAHEMKIRFLFYYYRKIELSVDLFYDEIFFFNLYKMIIVRWVIK